jgi:GABA(A) receptor-associated protein
MKVELSKKYKDAINPDKIYKIVQRYPNRIPVFIDKSSKSNLESLKKNKYLVNSNMTLGEYMFYIRKEINLSSSKALFFYFNNNLESCSNTMGALFKKHKNKDYVLVIVYDTENTFG